MTRALPAHLLEEKALQTPLEDEGTLHPACRTRNFGRPRDRGPNNLSWTSESSISNAEYAADPEALPPTRLNFKLHAFSNKRRHPSGHC